MNDAILKVWRQIKNPIPSIDACLLEEQFFQILSWYDLKRRSRKIFWRGSQEDNEEQQQQDEDK